MHLKLLAILTEDVSVLVSEMRSTSRIQMSSVLGRFLQKTVEAKRIVKKLRVQELQPKYGKVVLKLAYASFGYSDIASLKSFTDRGMPIWIRGNDYYGKATLKNIEEGLIKAKKYIKDCYAAKVFKDR